jgi:hypothetical protein
VAVLHRENANARTQPISERFKPLAVDHASGDFCA